MRERVIAALKLVDRERYFLDHLGNQLPQTTRPEVIACMLQLLDVRPGQRVLEIGTGSAYSTALLAELTRPNGRIVSLDVDPEITSRATRLLADAGLSARRPRHRRRARRLALTGSVRPPDRLVFGE